MKFNPTLFTLVLAMTIPIQNRLAAAEPETQSLCEGNTTFACDLYGKLKSSPGNLFFSPNSISTALAMTYAGARGDTAKQMAQTLHFTQDPAKLHASYSAMLEEINAIQKKGKVQLTVANSLWPGKEFSLLPDFLDLTRKSYGVSITPVDYRESEAACKTINQWVEEKTNQKIKNLIPGGALDATTKLVLVNAIYFKGDWAIPFQAEATKDQPFHLSPGQTVQAPLMQQTKRFRHAETDQLQLLELPYAGNDLAMLILLPKKVDGLAALEDSLTTTNLEKWSRSLKPQEVAVSLPRFKMTCRFGLNAPLQALGMKDAFNGGSADFSGMDGKRDLFISAAIHKAFVEVNEKGTEAAAATGIAMRLTAMRPTEPVEFRADHPFLFLIQEKQTGSILFLGRMANPTAAGE